ncbi:hypothetical protein C451_19628 [Halococcus thailandensis JCM 13552]|uniref:Uncharacterized protein n=1 Tax=Halococcus thailandensis JCM 13552 TaxID=1227457 RepID=M0MUI1_9EURY|nr:hypothetical protein C451_19628 [Halococcus thailandensis JCM 13552]
MPTASERAADGALEFRYRSLNLPVFFGLDKWWIDCIKIDRATMFFVDCGVLLNPRFVGYWTYFVVFPAIIPRVCSTFGTVNIPCRIKVGTI